MDTAMRTAEKISETRTDAIQGASEDMRQHPRNVTLERQLGRHCTQAPSCLAGPPAVSVRIQHTASSLLLRAVDMLPERACPNRTGQPMDWSGCLGCHYDFQAR